MSMARCQSSWYSHSSQPSTKLCYRRMCSDERLLKQRTPWEFTNLT